MKFFAAIKASDFAVKLSAAAGFDFAAAFAAGDVNALKTHIDAESAKAVAAATKPDSALTEQVAALNAALESAKAENETITAALSGVGFTIPEDVSTTTGALQTFIKVRAQGILAQAGHPAIESAPASANPEGAASATLTGRDRYTADFNRQIASRINRRN